MLKVNKKFSTLITEEFSCKGVKNWHASIVYGILYTSVVN